ncbi:MAG: hypothetical protein JF595_00300, partial [Sphingomonadales bacterium]|nr:hypothetical protein [Sphingomonadales bacterium]
MTGRRLNHVEFAHRPGEGDLAAALFKALGCTCEAIDTPPYGKYIVVSLDGSPHGENDMFASQAEPEQLALEEALARAAAADTLLAKATVGFRGLQRDKAFRATHVGLRMPSVPALGAVIARLAALAEGDLAGRLELGLTMERSREEARATSSPMKQIWIWTDVISTGLLTLGQQFEL